MKRVTGSKEEWMKYICLGYLDPGKFENMSESERNTVFDECFSYNDELRKNGHLLAEESLQPANTAVTVSLKNGKVVVTDGPYAETKEQVGGIQVLEARDLNHAIQLISQCPGVKLKCGTIEIRPAADMNEIMRENARPHTIIPNTFPCPDKDDTRRQQNSCRLLIMRNCILCGGSRG